jgi:hypothetical protein
MQDIPTRTYEIEDMAAQACTIHKMHSPANLTVEWHHVVPVAWQLNTLSPSSRPAPGMDTSGRGMLWDIRGVWLCPTGHRNVHHWIVLMTRALNANPAGGIPGALSGILPRFQATQEAKTAVLGLDRAASCSVDFAALAAAGEWGQA